MRAFMNASGQSLLKLVFVALLIMVGCGRGSSRGESQVSADEDSTGSGTIDVIDRGVDVGMQADEFEHRQRNWHGDDVIERDDGGTFYLEPESDGEVE